MDVFPALFRSRIDERNRIMATGEALSHLHYLEELGELRRDADRDGVNWYRLRQ